MKDVQTIEPMVVHATYPSNIRRGFWKRSGRSLLRSLFLLVSYICLLIDLLTPGIAWSLIVIGGLVVVWVCIIYKPQVENTIIKKLCDMLTVICLYLFLLDSVVGGGWSEMVVPIVFFGDLIFIGAYFLLFFKKRKRDFLPLFELMLVGVVSTLSALIGLRYLNWPMIVLGSVSLALFILSLAIFRGEMIAELKKKFHI